MCLLGVLLMKGVCKPLKLIEESRFLCEELLEGSHCGDSLS